MVAAGDGASHAGPEAPAFDTPNILWFVGGFTAAGAADAVIASVHPSARGVWILLASLAFLAVFALLSAALLRVGWWIPGGVLAAMAVTFVAPAGGAFERLVGLWRGGVGVDPLQEFEGPVFSLALVVAVAALIAFALVRFHFILAVAGVAAFVALQLLLPIVVTQPGPKAHATMLVVVGAAFMALGLTLDWSGERRAAFWWHLIGLISLAVGLGYHAFRHATWGWILIFVVGCGVLVLAGVLVRGTWAAFGVAGVYAPVAHYFDVWFANLGTAFAIGAFGLALLGLGIVARRSGGVWPLLQPQRP